MTAAMDPRPLTITSQIKFLCGLWGLQKIPSGYVFTPYIKRGDKTRKWTPRFWKYPLSEDDQSALEEFLSDHDRDDVYFSPTIYNRRRAEKTNAKMSRLLFADFDEVNPLEFGEVMQPHFVWETSPGSWQGVYVLAAPLEPEAFEHWNRKLTYHFGADKGCWPINHVIRIPGRRNYKPQNGPQGAPGRLWRQARGVVHLTSDEWKALPEVQETQAFTPDVLLPATGHDHSALVKSVKGKMPPSIWRWLTQMPDHDDRSTACHTLAKELFRAQLSADEVGAVLWLAPVFKEKYGSRIEPMSELKREVEKALQALLRDGWTYDEKAATVAEPEPEVDKALELTEAADAARMVAMFGEDIHYVDKWKAWLVWDGVVWRRDHTFRVEEMAVLSAKAFAKRAIDQGTKSEMAVALKWAKSSLSSKGVSACLRLAKSIPGISITPELIDADPWLFNCTGHTVELRTGVVREPRREDLLTKQSPVVWDPKAKSPTWEKALRRWFPDPDVRAYVQRAAGYSMTGSLREKCFFVLKGESDAGKNKFSEALRYVLGGYGANAQVETFLQKAFANPNNDGLANLMGSRFVSLSELTPGMRLDMRTIKALTGTGDGTYIRAMRKHETEFDYMPQMKLWIDTNFLPKIGHTDDAAYNRFKLIPFGPPIPKSEQDAKLDEKLRAESAGILAWMIHGLKQWLDLGGLTEPEAIKEAVSEQRAKEDTFSLWLEENTVRTSSTKGIQKTELKKRYMEDNDIPRLTPRTFDDTLRRVGLDPTPKTINNQRCIKGLRWKGDNDD